MTLIIYGLLGLGFVPVGWEAFQIVSFFMIYGPIFILDALGLPWLLENNGLCGAGICELTILGWGFVVIFWQAFVFIVLKLTMCLPKNQNN